MLVMVAGLPASGKSTWAKKHFHRVLEYDSFAEKLGSYEDLEEDRDMVNRQFALLAGSGKYDAVVDVFHTRESRLRILKACPSAGLVIVQTPLDTCLRRNASRLRSWLGNDELKSIAYSWEPVCSSEGFQFICAISGIAGCL